MVGVIRKRPAKRRHPDDGRTLHGADVIPPIATVLAESLRPDRYRVFDFRNWDLSSSQRASQRLITERFMCQQYAAVQPPIAPRLPAFQPRTHAGYRRHQ